MLPVLNHGSDGLTPQIQLTAIAGERMRRDANLFAQRAWPLVEPKRAIWNWHMSAILEHLVYVTQGEIRNLMVMIPPRMTKTTLCSILWPVWHWLQIPGAQFIAAGYEKSLVLEAAQASRRLIESPWFQKFYGHRWYLLPDENKKELYRNSKGGYRISTSVCGKTAGFGGDIQLLDDPNNTKQVESDAVRQGANEWHDNAWRSRMNNPNKTQKVYVAQRTHDSDVMGHVLATEPHRWVQLVLPMEFDPKRICITYPNKGSGVIPEAKAIFKDPRKKEGELLNPKRFNKDTAQVEQDAMSVRAWNAQYQQQPEGAGGLILKKHWWKQWVYPEWHMEAGKVMPLPTWIEIIQVYDTAFEEEEENSKSARTTWGIFVHRESIKDPKTGVWRDGRQRVCAMLLDWFEDRVEYPTLRDELIRAYRESDPDLVLVEKKASGHSLIQEIRRHPDRIPIKGVKLTDGGDLIARIHTASLMLEKGCIYYVPRKWSLRLIDQVAKFPNGDHDDTEATLAIAWQYMRRHSDLTLPDDEDEKDIAPFRWKRRAKYG